MSLKCTALESQVPAALPGYVCEDCGTVFLADEVRKSEVDTRGGPATEYRCAKPGCHSTHIDPCTICPICEVAQSAEGYDECAACIPIVDQRLLEADLKRQREKRRDEFSTFLMDIARVA